MTDLRALLLSFTNDRFLITVQNTAQLRINLKLSLNFNVVGMLYKKYDDYNF